MPYVTVRSVSPQTAGVPGSNAFSNVGHAWVEISGSNVSPNGAPESFGYYPETNGDPYGPGEIRDTDASDYAGLGDTSQSYYITEEQAQAIRDYAAQVDAGIYEVLPGFFGYNNNCATFVFEAMRQAGFQTSLPLRNVLPWWLPNQFTPAGGNLMDLELGIDFSVNADFLAARAQRQYDPLAIDLDGDGIETVGIAGGVLFDHDGDGIRTGTGWVKGDDAFVVLDKNGNGLIDSGAELFGVDYIKSSGQKAANGFDALAAQLADLQANYRTRQQFDAELEALLWGAYRIPLDGNAPPLPEKYLRAVYLIETLERTNGLPFIDFDLETGAITGGTGRAIAPEQGGGGSARNVTSETRRWRSGGEAANGEWRRVA